MRTILVVSAALVVLGVTAPGMLTKFTAATGSRAGADAVRVDTPAAEIALSRGGPSQVSIRAARDGHFYLDAEINFRDIRFMVDTGATVVALRESDAAAAGIRVGKSDFDQKVATANGVTYAADVLINSVTVADIRVNGVRALVLPDDSLSISLLGSTFLNKLGRFEVADGTLIFEN